jgi:hypothetical protein
MDWLSKRELYRLVEAVMPPSSKSKKSEILSIQASRRALHYKLRGLSA